MKNSYINKSLSGIILIIFFLSACSGQADFDIDDKDVREIVENDADSVDVHRYFPDDDVRAYLHNEFNEFYKNREHRLAWLTFDEPTPQADELLEAIDAANEEGMSPEHYSLPEIEKLLAEVYDIDSRKKRRKEWRKKLIKSKKFKDRLKQQDSVLFKKIVQLDFFMTANYLTYASHLLSGKIRPGETAEWYSKPREKDLSAYLENAIDENTIKESLAELNPPHPQYGRLKEKLAFYRQIKNKGGWQEYTISQNLRSGNKNSEVVKLKKRLHLINYFDASSDTSEVFNDELKKAIQSFQMNNGLPVTGTVNEKTRTLLNQPVDEIISKITFNMERMRWIHGPFGNHYILVNIPAFQMAVIKDDNVVLKMKAIVGENVNKTPVFYDSLEYLVFSPEWNVPNSIAVNEMLPLIKKNPGYLPSKNYVLYSGWQKDAEELSPYSVPWDTITAENFSFKIVEKPGPANSLGRVKFIFPNSNSIYLHDTPANHLFSENKRDFSHGCIRLEQPDKFAHYLLEGKGWDHEDVVDHMHKGEPQTVMLDKKIPVYIVYWTAWVDEKTKFLNLRDDVYSYDKVQMEKIKEKEQLLSAVAED